MRRFARPTRYRGAGAAVTPPPTSGGLPQRFATDLSDATVASPMLLSDMRAFLGGISYGGNSNLVNTEVRWDDGPDGTAIKVLQQNFPYNGGTNYAMPDTGTGISLTSAPLAGGNATEAKIGFWFRGINTVAGSTVPPWGWGFKIPGLGGVGQGRTSVPTGGAPSPYGFSCRLMGRRRNSIIESTDQLVNLKGYFYAPWQQAGAIGVDLDTGVTLQSGRWHYIEQYHKMNTVTTEGSTNPPADGIHRIWLDSNLVYEDLAVVYRFYSDCDIGNMVWDNFYGGSDAADGKPWGPRVNAAHQFTGLYVLAA